MATARLRYFPKQQNVEKAVNRLLGIEKMAARIGSRMSENRLNEAAKLMGEIRRANGNPPKTPNIDALRGWIKGDVRGGKTGSLISKAKKAKPKEQKLNVCITPNSGVPSHNKGFVHRKPASEGLMVAKPVAEKNVAPEFVPARGSPRVF